MRIDSPFVNIHKYKNFFTLIFLALFSITSALAVIYIKHKNRVLHMLLQKIHIERSKLNTEWSKLILEKSTLTADFRIEQIAKQELGMVMPEQIEFIGSS